jgi:hypothetical protein
MLRGGRVSWMLFARNVILVGLFALLLFELAARGRAWAASRAEKGSAATRQAPAERVTGTT